MFSSEQIDSEILIPIYKEIKNRVNQSWDIEITNLAVK